MSEDIKQNTIPYYEDAIKLCHEVFSDKEEFLRYYFDVFLNNNSFFHIIKDDILASMLIACNYKWRYQNKDIPFAYISYVCTKEDYRKQGLAEQLIKQTLQALYKQNYLLSGLISANEHLITYYNKFSFASCCSVEYKDFERRYINNRLVDTHILINNPDFLSLLSADKFERYYKFNENAVVHSKQSLQPYLDDYYVRFGLVYNGFVVAFAVGIKYTDRIELLFLKSINSTYSEALLSHICKKYKRYVHYPLYGKNAKNDSLQMLRIINARKCLEYYAVKHSKEDFSIHIIDDIIEENNITVRIREGEVINIDNSYKVKSIRIEELTEQLFDSGYMYLMLDR